MSHKLKFMKKDNPQEKYTIDKNWQIIEDNNQMDNECIKH